MTISGTKSQGLVRAAEAKRRARQARLQRSTGSELGYKPTFTGKWQRERPTQRGVYPIVAREGGLWLGQIAVPSQAWAGWWWSEPVAAGRDLTRLPPAPGWDTDSEEETTATGADGRPQPAPDAVPIEKRR